jgi:hypothetical protein
MYELLNDYFSDNVELFLSGGAIDVISSYPVSTDFLYQINEDDFQIILKELGDVNIHS